MEVILSHIISSANLARDNNAVSLQLLSDIQNLDTDLESTQSDQYTWIILCFSIYMKQPELGFKNRTIPVGTYCIYFVSSFRVCDTIST